MNNEETSIFQIFIVLLNLSDLSAELQEWLYIRVKAILSSQMDVNGFNKFNRSSIGEICIAKCETENERIVIIVVIYISPNQNVNKIIEFIHENLHIYTIAGSALLNQNLHQLPMILSGDILRLCEMYGIQMHYLVE
jgi:hypothetical protein